MKALVVGGLDGQVARSLAELDDPEFRIDVRGRPEADLTAPATLSASIAEVEPDVVIISGAYTAVDQAESDVAMARALNADGPGAVAKACAAANIPVVHISTDYVFDGAKTSPYLETDPTSPRSVYGETKLAGELAVASSGARHVILRVSWVHAPEGKNFVRTMLRLADKRDRINVVADRSAGRPTRRTSPSPCATSPPGSYWTPMRRRASSTSRARARPAPGASSPKRCFRLHRSAAARLPPPIRSRHPPTPPLRNAQPTP